MDAQRNLTIATGTLLTRFMRENPHFAGERLETMSADDALEILQEVPIEVAILVWNNFSMDFAVEVAQRATEAWLLDVIAGANPKSAAGLVQLSYWAARTRNTKTMDSAKTNIGLS